MTRFESPHMMNNNSYFKYNILSMQVLSRHVYSLKVKCMNNEKLTLYLKTIKNVVEEGDIIIFKNNNSCPEYFVKNNYIFIYKTLDDLNTNFKPEEVGYIGSYDDEYVPDWVPRNFTLEHYKNNENLNLDRWLDIYGPWMRINHFDSSKIFDMKHYFYKITEKIDRDVSEKVFAENENHSIAIEFHKNHWMSSLSENSILIFSSMSDSRYPWLKTTITKCGKAIFVQNIKNEYKTDFVINQTTKKGNNLVQLNCGDIIVDVYENLEDLSLEEFESFHCNREISSNNMWYNIVQRQKKWMKNNNGKYG